MKHKGNLILVLDDTLVVRAHQLEASAGGIVIDEGKFTIDPNRLTNSWHLDPDGQLATGELAEKSRIGATMLGLELAASSYEKETGSPAWQKSEAPAIFGAASLTLTLLQNRVSEDVDIALAPQFFEWMKRRGEHNSPTDILPFDIFTMCGNWQSRAATVEGLKGMTFRVLHPLDTVMQKLLRAEDPRFELKDKGDIRQVMDLLAPSSDVLMGMLTENHLRYRPPIMETGSRFRRPIEMHQAMKANTQWFLDTFLPGARYEEIALISEERHLSALGDLAGPSKIAVPKAVAEILKARSITMGGR